MIMVKLGKVYEMKNKKMVWIAVVVALAVVLSNFATYVLLTNERTAAEEKIYSSLHDLKVEIENDK